MRSLGTTLLLVLLLKAANAQPPKDAPPDEPETPSRLTLVLDPGGHTAAVGNVAFAPNGMPRLYTGSSDQTLRVWGPTSGRLYGTIRGPGICRFDLFALSPDGKRVAVPAKYPDGKRKDGDPTYEDLIYVFGVPDGKLERVLHGSANTTTALAFSPSGKQLASGEYRAVRVWDLATGKVQHAFETTMRVEALAFAPRGTGLAQLTQGQTAGRAALRNLAADRFDVNFFRDEPGQHALTPQSIAWSPNGELFAAGNSNGCRVWDKDGQLRHHFLPQTAVAAVAFGKKSDSVLVTTLGSKSAIFDAKTGEKKAELDPKSGHTFGRAGAFSPDGTRAATSGGAYGSNDVLVWNTTTGNVEKKLGTPSWFGTRDIQAGWSPDSRAVAWRLAGKKDVASGAVQAAFRPDFLRFAFVGRLSGPVPKTETQSVRWKDGEAELVTAAKAIPLAKPAGIREGQGPLTLVGADRAAVTHVDDVVLYRTTDGSRVRILRHAAPVRSIAPSPDGRFLMTIANDQKLCVWSANLGTLLLSLFVHGKEWIAWTPQGYYAASPGGEQLVGWQRDNGIDALPSYYSAQQFRKQLYRPDVVQLVLEKGSVAEAVSVANAELRKAKGAVVAEVTDPEKLLPPTVSMSVDKSKLPAVTVAVTAEQAVPEQPIKSLRLFVDGRPLPGNQGFQTFDQPQAKAELRWTVELEPGEHKLEVMARSKDDTPSVSNVEEVTNPVPVVNRPTLHHLAVGINAYQQKNLVLGSARPDAELLARTFAAVNAPPKGLQYKEVNSVLLVDDRATRANVLQAIDGIRKAVQPSDLFVVTFAGHGVSERGEFYLLPVEADTTKLADTAVSGRALADKLADFPCPVLLMLDACQSAAVVGLKPGSDDAARSLSDVTVRVAVMCAAQGHEEAIAIDGRGLFSGAVADSLNKVKGAFFNPNGELTVHHLMAYVEQEVVKKSNRKQTPYLKMPIAQPAITLAK